LDFDHQEPRELAAAVNKAKIEYICLSGVTMEMCSLQCLSYLGKTFRQRLLSFRPSEVNQYKNARKVREMQRNKRTAFLRQADEKAERWESAKGTPVALNYLFAC